jgi:hypothetical protein
MPCVRAGEGLACKDAADAVPLLVLRAADLCNCWHDLSRYADLAVHMVPRHVVSYQPEDGRECDGPPARLGFAIRCRCVKKTDPNHQLRCRILPGRVAQAPEFTYCNLSEPVEGHARRATAGGSTSLAADEAAYPTYPSGRPCVVRV